MPSLKDIRTRIKSVKNTQKITRAMKLVAAAKLRRAQDNIFALRPYAYRLRETIWEVSRLTDTTDHPLLQDRDVKRVRLIVLTSDRGLCGGFNMNINRATEAFMKENDSQHEHTELAVVGKKGADYFGNRDVEIVTLYNDVLTSPSMERATEIGSEAMAAFQDDELDAVYVVYNEFKNAVTQDVVVEQLLPVVPEETADTSIQGVEFTYEPTKTEVLDSVVPLHINVQIYRAILESLASEMGARMTAMDSATNNAGELIDKLTLQFNRARQAAITKELMEIVGGAEALKG